MTDPTTAAHVAAERVEAFMAEMREQQIHLGVGPPGTARCVTCDEPWPCATEREARA